MGVDAAVRQQTQQVEAGILGEALVHSLIVGGDGEETAVLDGEGDAGQILKHHAAAADVGVTHLAVAHLTIGQTNVKTAGAEGGVGILGKETIQHGGVCHSNGVAAALCAKTETVHDNEGSRRFAHRK